MPLPLSQQQLENLVAAHPVGQRASVRRVVGGRASEVGTAFSRDQVEVVDDEGTLSLDFINSTTCDRNHVLGSDGAEAIGTCGCCGHLLCSRAGCSADCQAGHLMCADHAVRIGEQVWCGRHAAIQRAKLTVLFVLRTIARGAWALVCAIGKAVWNCGWNPLKF